MVVNVEQAASVETDRAREPNVIAPAASHELLRKQNDYYSSLNYCFIHSCALSSKLVYLRLLSS